MNLENIAARSVQEVFDIYKNTRCCNEDKALRRMELLDKVFDVIKELRIKNFDKDEYIDNFRDLIDNKEIFEYLVNEQVNLSNNAIAEDLSIRILERLYKLTYDPNLKRITIGQHLLRDFSKLVLLSISSILIKNEMLVELGNILNKRLPSLEGIVDYNVLFSFFDGFKGENGDSLIGIISNEICDTDEWYDLITADLLLLLCSFSNNDIKHDYSWTPSFTHYNYSILRCKKYYDFKPVFFENMLSKERYQWVSDSLNLSAKKELLDKCNGIDGVSKLRCKSDIVEEIFEALSN
ncbi:hypothetical protein FPV63_05355 [Vibrio cholerae]|nr:hypothetical protein FPV63_05355 [Vibrio cholerae]